MKRIKFMLVAVAVFAVVGGALAFKAKGTNIFCTDLQHFGARADNGACPQINNRTFVEATTELNKISYCTFAGFDQTSTCSISVSLLQVED